MIDGADRVLCELQAAGYTLGVVSSGNSLRVLREIEGHGFDGTFDVVVCDEDVTRKKPDPEGLQIAMARLNKSPGACCYVGDCREDVEMGKRAGVLTIGVLSRFPNSEKIMEADPDIALESIDLLLGYLK
jgi:HAD superfamily hydrolase (TIGR01509 family)